MTQPVRFGLIGAGGIGAYHRAAIEAQELAGAARLVAVADPWADRLAPQKAELESRGVRWHLDYRDMLRLETELDAVVIATPIPFHYDMAMACIARGLMIHLEKPPVPLLSQLDALLAADARQSISVGFQMIGAHCVQLLKQAISEGRLGQVRHIRAAGCWPRLDGYYARASWAGKMTLNGAPVFDGPATNAFAHLIHNVMYFAAGDRNEFAIPEEIEGELYRARPLESYDTAVLRGTFASGADFAVAVTHANEATRPFSMEVLGTKGWARLTEDGAKLESNIGLECDCPQSTQQLLDVNHLNFIDVITGRADHFTTRLADTRGYVSATNAMLLSSGGIHDIGPDHARKYERDGQTGYDVAGLGAAMEETCATGRLFNEQGCPWASAKPRPIRLPLDQEIALA
jgi:predicted dehydrogenase